VVKLDKITKELVDLIKERPDLPILPVIYSEYSMNSCCMVCNELPITKCVISKFLVHKGRVRVEYIDNQLQITNDRYLSPDTPEAIILILSEGDHEETL